MNIYRFAFLAAAVVLITAAAIPKGNNTLCSSCTVSIPDSTDMFQAVSMGVNTEGLLTPGPDLQPGGTWNTELGSITNGYYHAPDYSPTGLDKITYVDPEGIIAVAYVRVTGGETRILELPATTNGEPDLNSQAWKDWSWPNQGDHTSGEMGTDIHVIGQPALRSLNWLTEEELPKQGNFFLLPTYINGKLLEGGIRFSTLTDVPMEDPKKVQRKGGPFNLVNPPKGRCSERADDWFADGYINSAVTRGPWTNVGTQTVKIDLNFSGSIKAIYNFELEVGTSMTLNLKSRDVNWTQSKIRDIYRCINGKWTYIGSQRCTKTGTGQDFNPRWWSVISGWPPYGKPDSWTPWQCVKTTKGF